MEIPALDVQLKTLPDSPGVYQYFDKNGKILAENMSNNALLDTKKRISQKWESENPLQLFREQMGIRTNGTFAENRATIYSRKNGNLTLARCLHSELKWNYIFSRMCCTSSTTAAPGTGPPSGS